MSTTNSSQTGYSYKNFAYNASGQIIAKAEKAYGNASYKTQNYYYSPTGGELANVGQLKVDLSPLSAVYAGGGTPSSYTVAANDTLMGIAQSLFGDDSLWYLIADANGLSMGPTDVFSGNDVGRNLRIPNGDKVVGNSGSNYKPYNPSEIIGDLTPDTKLVPLPPPKKSGCGKIAQIVMVVVTIYTAGAAASFFAGAGNAVGFGAAVAGGAVGGFGTGYPRCRVGSC